MTDDDDPRLIWKDTVDGGVWEAKVVASDDDRYRGTLTVAHCASGTEMLRQEVGLSYGAIFGPDYADVMAWQDITVDTIDYFNELANAQG